MKVGLTSLVSTVLLLILRDFIKNIIPLNIALASLLPAFTDLTLKGNNEKLKDILLNTNNSRIPIYDRIPDNIIGSLLVKTYFKEITQNPNVSIRKI